jgi:hypothetical protein
VRKKTEANGSKALGRFTIKMFIWEPREWGSRDARVAAPEWLQPHLRPAWTERYGTRFEDYRLPKAAAAREALAAQMGDDGRQLLEALFAAEAPLWLRNVPAVRTLQQVWIQQFDAVPSGEPMRWRKNEDAPPAAQMINSPYDPEARYSVKRDTTWTGYKVHLTESCDEDTPHLITHVVTTEASTPDWHAAAVIHPALAAKDLLPAEHLLDAGYVDSGVVVTSQREHQVRVIGPVPLDNHWQARRVPDLKWPASRWIGRRVWRPVPRGRSAANGRRPMIRMASPSSTFGLMRKPVRSALRAPRVRILHMARGRLRFARAPNMRPCSGHASIRRPPSSKRSIKPAQGLKAPSPRGCG